MQDTELEKVSSFLKKRISEFEVKPIVYRRGRVDSVGDGVVRISGLPTVFTASFWSLTAAYTVWRLI